MFDTCVLFFVAVCNFGAVDCRVRRVKGWLIYIYTDVHARRDCHYGEANDTPFRERYLQSQYEAL